MKKIILSAIAVMAFAFTNAQETRFGVKGGLNLSTLTGEYEDDTKSLVGFHVGGFAEIKVIERLAIQPELLFSAQGARFEDVFGKYDAKLNYINIPVLAKFYITKQFTVEAGPQLGFLVSAKIEGEDAKDIYKSADFGFNFGAGYNFTDNFSAGVRYTLGLSGVYDNDNEDLEDYLDSSKNSNFAVYAAYKF
ncbi:porin family protein [Flavobacterium phragmitis]|uniref:Outer membrane protein beta-barrel domain-containing protein n=1 Tax=Flavobacterium phragmitis TaxID=739143 RepID=A0A1I1VQW3_9FLAO|nr:porin family protein [Flavobacterium phragmitis]SFD85462.1 Outer membrane protein beta-barrel domain-containing protein [Flavobacterium phragmitis]